MFESIRTRARPALTRRLVCLVLATVCVSPSSRAQPDPYSPSQTERAAAFPDFDAAHTGHAMLEDPLNHLLLFDQLESQSADSADGLSWNVDGWFGYSLNKLRLRSEGERWSGATEQAELQALWGRALTRWWEFVAGLRQDSAPGPDLSWVAIGLQGRAPYMIDVQLTSFLAEGGRGSVRLEAESDILITNRLILAPWVELDWNADTDALRGRGSGLANAEFGFRLRFEIRREFAPYLGILWVEKFGATATLARQAGQDPDTVRLVLGLRTWF
jgi:copper resistance protein B